MKFAFKKLQDFPRWGDYPDKLKLDYLAELKHTGENNLIFLSILIFNLLRKYSKKLFSIGKWFDGGQPTAIVNETMDPDFAPEFVLSHAQQYKQLIEGSKK